MEVEMKDWILELVQQAKLIVCPGCGRKKKHSALGLCTTCYNREINSYSKDNHCIDCGKSIINESVRCGRCAKRGELNPMWKDEKSDYRIVLVGYKGKPILEHRLVMMGVIGRPLKPEEVVHHIDGDPSNNVRENLELFENHSKHMKHCHNKRRIEWKF